MRVESEVLEHVVSEFDRTNSWFNRMVLFEHVHRRGVWAPTWERAAITVSLTARMSHSVQFTGLPSIYAEAISEHVATAPRQPHPGSWMDANFLAHGETESTRVVWSGYAINAATLVGLGLIGWGACGVPGAIRARRVRAGKCAKCRYDLRGLGEARCPECGTPLPVACGDHPPPCGEREAEQEFGREPAG
jgi:hypothetical protein